MLLTTFAHQKGAKYYIEENMGPVVESRLNYKKSLVKSTKWKDIDQFENI